MISKKQQCSIDQYLSLIKYLDELKSLQQSQRLENQDLIFSTQLKFVLNYYQLQKFGFPFKIITSNDNNYKQIFKDLIQNLKSKQDFIKFVLNNKENQSLLNDFCLLFPWQITIIDELSKQKSNEAILKKIFKLLIKRKENRLIKNKLLKRMKKIITKYHFRLNLQKFYQEELRKSQEIQFQKIVQEMASDNNNLLHLRGPRNALVVSGIVDNRFQFIQQNKQCNFIQQLLYTFFENLKKHFNGLGYEVRYLFKKMFTNDRKQQMKKQIFESITKQLKFRDGKWNHSKIVNNQHEIHKNNLQQIKNLLIIFLQRNKRFKNRNFQKLYDYFSQQIQLIIDDFTYLNYEYLEKQYEKNKKICCLSFETLKSLGYPIQQQNAILMLRINNNNNYQNVIPLKSKMYEFCKNNINKKQHINQICGSILEKEFKQIKRVVKYNFEVFLNNKTKYLNYVNWIEHQQKHYFQVIKFIQKEQRIRYLNSIWHQIQFSQPFYFFIDKNIIKITQKEGLLITNLNQFVQYLANSQNIVTMIETGKNLTEISSIFKQVMLKLKQDLQNFENHNALYELITEKIFTILFQNYLIKQGRSSKDKSLFLKMSNTKLTLKDMDLDEFQNEEQLFFQAVDNQSQYLDQICSPLEILKYFNRILQKLQFIMKLSNPKSFMTGDSMISAIHFILVRKRMNNISTLLNYLKAFFIAEDCKGILQYLFTLVEAVIITIQKDPK